MSFNSTKKTIVFLSAILVSFSSFGMKRQEAAPDKKILVVNMGSSFSLPQMPKIKLTRNSSAALAVALPLTVATAVCYKNDIMAKMPEISLPNDRRIVGILGTALAMPLVYVGMQPFTPEDRAKKYKARSDENREHATLGCLVRNEIKTGDKKIEFINNKLSVDGETVREFINNKFSDEIHKGRTTNMKAVEELAKLKASVEKEESTLKDLQASGFERIQYNYPDKSEKKAKIVVIKTALAEIEEVKNRIEIICGQIPLKSYLKEEAMSFERQKMSLLSKMSALAPMMASPAIGNLITLFFQYIFSLFGSAKELPLQANSPAVVFVNNTVHQVQPNN